MVSTVDILNVVVNTRRGLVAEAIHWMQSRTTADEMALCKAWGGQFFSSPAEFPIAFRYDGKHITGIPSDWSPVSRQRRIDANIVETIVEGRHAGTGLAIKLECLQYLDHAVVEWTAWLTNHGSQPTPLLEDIVGLAATFEGTPAVLYHCNGDFNSEEGYAPQETPLMAGQAYACAPEGGRPCDRAFPYFRIQFAGRGLTLAVGWPGQWSASFTGTETGVTVTAGQEVTHLRLLPGESIRTPRITLLAWSGDADRAVNMWRRWYRDHVLPRSQGQPLRPLLVATSTDEGEEFTAATEDNQIRYMDMWRQAGFNYDVWWIDAGWYPCYNEKHERKWTLTGTWEPDPERFPRGFGPVGAHVARNDADFLVWFEPERVSPGTWLYDNHPEWLLRIADTNDWASRNALLNLGNPACRQWLTDHYCRLIQDSGIKIYRQDFNFPPLRHWRENDAEDRQGINENLHVQGYLHFWDDLLARNPGLWIDSCASGGRRNDLETMRRSVPLHYTDHGYGVHRVKLAFQHTLYAWIPYFKEFTLSWDLNKPEDPTGSGRSNDSFAYHCAMAPMVFINMDIRATDNDIPLGLTMVDIWRRASNVLVHGDYYPLTPFSKSPDQWVVRQFDDPATSEGVIQAIRLAACPIDTITVYPKGLHPEMTYLLNNPESGETKEISGEALINQGFSVECPPRSGAMWFYKVKSRS